MYFYICPLLTAFVNPLIALLPSLSSLYLIHISLLCLPFNTVDSGGKFRHPSHNWEVMKDHIQVPPSSLSLPHSLPLSLSLFLSPSFSLPLPFSVYHFLILSLAVSLSFCLPPSLSFPFFVAMLSPTILNLCLANYDASFEQYFYFYFYFYFAYKCDVTSSCFTSSCSTSSCSTSSCFTSHNMYCIVRQDHIKGINFGYRVELREEGVTYLNKLGKMHYKTLYRSAVHCIVLYFNAIQCTILQYNTVHYITIQYNTIQYNTMQYNTIQYSAL
jgi:hypothetical protein